MLKVLHPGSATWALLDNGYLFQVIGVASRTPLGVPLTYECRNKDGHVFTYEAGKLFHVTPDGKPVDQMGHEETFAYNKAKASYDVRTAGKNYQDALRSLEMAQEPVSPLSNPGVPKDEVPGHQVLGD